MKLVRFILGGVFIAMGLAMLVVLVRDGAGGGGAEAWLAPLGLIGAGVLVISHARRKPKKW